MLKVQRDHLGKAIFVPFRRIGDEEIRATDARRIGELDSLYLTADNRELAQPTSKREKLIITTPNADFLPHVNLNTQVISMCIDGRWGAEDWSRWPQWYFDGQEHLSYILSRPSKEDLKAHPLRLLWWDITKEDFELRSEGLDQESGCGVLRPSVAQELFDIRSELMKEVDTCVCRIPNDFVKLHASAGKMRQCTSSLLFTFQSYTNVMITLAAAQRYCLETRALLDKVMKWDKMVFTDSIPPIDGSVLGCITDRATVVHDMHEKGIPVWYVRSPPQIPKDINVVEPCEPTRPAQTGIQMTRFEGAPIFYQGPLSHHIHDALNNWKPGGLNLQLLQPLPQTRETVTLPKRQTPREAPYSMTRAKNQIARKKPTAPINHVLFNLAPSPLSSRPLDVWKEALRCVDVNPSRIIDHANLQLFHGYSFPPPHIFLGNTANAMDFMLAWLAIRGSWMVEVGEEHTHARCLPNPQQWRNFLIDLALKLELTRPDQRHHSNASSHPPSSKKSKLRSDRARDANKDVFTIALPSRDLLHQISWNNHIVWQRNQTKLSLHDRQLVVWDTQEHNFRMEFLCLDRSILPDAWATSSGRTQRERKFAKVWPNDDIMMIYLPSNGLGIAAEDWTQRRQFVDAFRQIVMDWPGPVPRQLACTSLFRPYGDNEVAWDKLEVERVELLAAKHYCQCFFDYFGRAPCIPHVLPIVSRI